MTGLDRVKQQFNVLITRATNDAVRREEGMKVPERTMHLVFAGPPGTGKTTAARLLADAYYAVGMVERNTVKEVSGRDLVSEYQAGSAKQVQDIFDEAKGGVLFVDEAYAMVNGPHDTPGIEALNQFLKLAEDRRDNTVVILAGYGGDGHDDVVEYLNRYNPGLKSRFPTRVPFDAYNAQQLAKIGEGMLTEAELSLADTMARKTFKAAAFKAGGGEDPSNARGVRSLVSAIGDAQAQRLAALGRRPTRAELSQITTQDVKDGLAGLVL